MKTGKMWPSVVAPEHPGHAGEVLATELKGMAVTDRAKVFKARMDAYFREQVAKFAAPAFEAHFPLVVMTCVGIETLGAYKYGDLGRVKRAKGRKAPVKDRHFQLVVEDMDADFKSTATDPEGSSRPLSDFVHEGFRHSLVHGYYGKWVSITAQTAETADWFYDPAVQALVVNVFWFYQKFCEVYDHYFKALLGSFDPTRDPLKTFDETFRKYFGRWF
jgi:hypothetical protein